jgi:hypothetical protein
MRQKLPSFIRNKDQFDLEVDSQNRATMMVEDYVATEEDLESQVVHDSELYLLEEGAEALYVVFVSSLRSAPLLISVHTPSGTI